MISKVVPCFEGHHRSCRRDICVCVGGGRDLTWLEVAKQGLPENMAFELRAEGPAGAHGMKAKLGERHTLRRGNRMCKGPEQMPESQDRWDPESVAEMRQGLCHAGSRRFL